jgi:TDG/mug DNA glycosylase family protein
VNHPPGWKPSKEEIAAAYGIVIPDVIAEDLKVLFCGINPSLYSGATGDHFARPGNRFWTALHASGFTDRLLHPSEKKKLLDSGLGVTNLVPRATARADELDDDEFRAGVKALEKKARRFRPRYIAFLGLGAYRIATGNKKASVGPQKEAIGGSRVWLLPNPSGLNAHYQAADLARVFSDLRKASTDPTAAWGSSRPPVR